MMRFLLLWWLLLWYCSRGYDVTANEEDEFLRRRSEQVISSFLLPTNNPNDDVFDENGKLSSYLLVYPLHRTPPEAIFFDEPVHGYKHYAVAADALYTVFPDYQEYGNQESGGQSSDKYDWMVACLDKGTDRSVAGHTWPEKHYYSQSKRTKTMTSKEQQEDFKTWFATNCHRVELCISNNHSRKQALLVYSMDTWTGQAQYKLSVRYGKSQTQCFMTNLGQAFRVNTLSPLTSGLRQELIFLDEFSMEHDLFRDYGDARKPVDASEYGNLTQTIENKLRFAWDGHNSFQRTFSPLGFTKGLLPPELFASMQSYFYNNRFNKIREYLGPNRVTTNCWEANIYLIQIPWNLAKSWASHLVELVSTWAGIPLESTAIYGMRQYEHNSRVVPHVDHRRTHALALIVNVAQGGLEEPWPIEILDHSERLHEVILHPGEILYYESAKNIHARTRPLKGRGAYYVNMFLHYRPVGEGDVWFQQQPTGGDVAVFETMGECRLRPIGTTAFSATRQLGIVQQVHCDDPRLGPHISPTLFQAQGPDDLLEWWHRAGQDHAPTVTH